MSKIEINTQVVAWDGEQDTVNSSTGFYVSEFKGKHLISSGNLDKDDEFAVSLWDYCKELHAPDRDEDLYRSLKTFAKAFPTAGEAIEALDSLRLRRTS